MTHFPRISEAEWEVMEVIWQRHPLAAIEVIEAIDVRRGWKANTIRTLLARLVQKGALKVEPDGNRYLYRPVFTRDQYVEDESQSFLTRVFRGSAKPLLIHFAEKSRLSRKQIAELKRILENAAH